MNPLIVEFLEAYADDYWGWDAHGFDAIARRVCENYVYSPQHGRDFILIATGWLWAKIKGDSMPFVAASCLAGDLEKGLNEVYKVVAAEHKWEESC